MPLRGSQGGSAVTLPPHAADLPLVRNSTLYSAHFTLLPRFFSPHFFDVGGELRAGKAGDFGVGFAFGKALHRGGGVKGVRFGVVAFSGGGEKPRNDVLLLQRKILAEGGERKLIAHGGGVSRTRKNAFVKGTDEVIA